MIVWHAFLNIYSESFEIKFFTVILLIVKKEHLSLSMEKELQQYYS
jgi:hypothetical protein